MIARSKYTDTFRFGRVNTSESRLHGVEPSFFMLHVYLFVISKSDCVYIYSVQTLL